MHVSWIINQYLDRQPFPEDFTLVIRDRSGREFSPNAVEWRENTLTVCEEEDDDQP